MKTRNGYLVDETGRFIHRVVMTYHEGIVPFGWVVHHIDGNKLNNDYSNLVQLPEKFHDYLHSINGWSKFSKTEIQEQLGLWLDN